MSRSSRFIAGTLALLTVVCLFVLFRANAGVAAASGGPSFVDRLKAQQDLERVYYSHRLWPAENPQPKPPFEEAARPADLEAKVARAVLESAALDEFWQSPITAEQLQAEMDRMARDTRDPAALQELFAALGDDPALVAECLARPALAERLIRENYAADPKIHQEIRREAEALWAQLEPATFESLGGDRYRPVHLEKVEGTAPESLSACGPDVIRLTEQGFAQAAAAFPEVGGISAVREEPEAFVILYTEYRDDALLAGGAIVFPKKSFDAWWSEVSPSLERREIPAAAGPYALPSLERDGAPVSADAAPAVKPPAAYPANRAGHTTLWTGAETILWGGSAGPYYDLAAGALYNPATDTWAALPSGSSASPRRGHTAVWTGKEMIVWGGHEGFPPYTATNTGGRYNPVTGIWSPTSTRRPCPAPSYGHTAAWSGTEMEVKGGTAAGDHAATTDGQYDPATDSWAGSVPETQGLCDTGFVANVYATGGTPWAGYATLKAAFDAINAGTHTGAIVIELCGDTTEAAVAGAASVTLNASGSGSASYTSISIKPIGGAARTISGAATAGFPLIDLNGADNVTFDGVNSGGDALTISNTTASATSGTSTIRFINGATSNTVTNCTVLGSFSATVATNGGNIYFATDGSTTNGNDNNTISYCDIGPAGANLPTKGIYSNGTATSASYYNSGITVTGNRIYDYFGAAVASAGLYILGGSTDWTISNNRFYQTASRTQTTGAQHSAIWILGSGNNYQITGNTIGYASSTGTGTYTFVGVSSSSVLIPIYLSVGSTTATSVQGNTIAAIAMSGAVSGTSTSAPFRGIYISAGLTNVGNVSGNTIGSQAATGSITYNSSSGSASDVTAMFNFGTSNWTAANNTIGGITASNSSTGAANVYGIRFNTSSSATTTLQNNTIGGSVANSIQSTSAATGTTVQGILSSTSIGTITGNTVRNLTAAGGTGTTTAASVIGICFASSTPNQTVSRNTIYGLTNTNTSAATIVTGIQFTGGTANVVERNLIYGLTSATNSASAEVNGIRVGGGTTVYRNNMIAIGAGIANALGSAATNSSTTGVNGFNGYLGTDSFFHNSIYIGGTATSGTGASYAFNGTQTINTRSFRDNIFFNARSNGGATGKHYAVKINGTAPNPTGLTINNNVYYANGSGAVFGYFNSLDVASLAAWRTAVGQDAGSFDSNPQYLDPTNAVPDLHINPSVATVIEANGADVGVADDFDGQTRAALTPVDIGADAGNFIGMDLMAPVITYTALSNTASTGDRTLTATITDVTGVPTSGALQPRIYYKKGPGGTWYSQPGTLTGGTGTSGTWDFTIVAADMAPPPLTTGDVIYYYLIAQDTAATPNIGSNPSGVVATDVNTVTTPPASPNSYSIVTGISGTKTVCSSGCDYDSLTNAGGVFADINAKAVTGNITVNITGDLTAETGAVALSQLAVDPPGSNFTVTIQPSGGAARVVSGSLASGALIKLNGADRVTIDGLNTGGNALAITNTSTTSPTAVALISLGAGQGATNDTIRNCSISTGVSAAAGYGIAVGGSTPGTQGADNDNTTLQNNTITVATNGIYAYGTASGSSGGLDNLAITGNNITSNTTIQNYGIQVGNALNSSVSQNTVSVTTSASAQPVAISLETGFVNSTVSRNKVTSALATNTGGYGGRGITVGTGTATSGLTIANNVIYGVNGSNYSGFGNSSSMGIAIGVVGSSGTLTTTTGGVNLYYNSVNMAGTYSYATACLTTALYVGSGASALDLRDNVLVNTLTNTNGSGGSSKNYAIYSAAANTAYTTINYDDYFVSGTQGVLGYLGADQATIAAWRTATGQDLNSIAADPLFNSATNLQPQTGSPVIGAGTPVSVTVDYTGAARSGTNPSIGAYETAVDTVGPTIAYTPLGNTTSTANRVLSASVTDPSGVPTSGIGLPVLYFRKGSSGAFTANPSVFTGGSGYDCTFDYSLVGGVIAGDTIQYYVAAQDTPGNVSVSPSAGAGGLTPNPPAAATPPTTPSSYLISTPLSGTLNVGTSEPHTSLTNPGGIFEYINANVLTGNLTIDITSDLTGETGSVALNPIAEEPAGSNFTVTIQPSGGAARVVSGALASGALIKLNGADRVTIDGLNSGGNALTITNTTTTSPTAVALISLGVGQGATNDAIRSCSISTGVSAAAGYGIAVGGSTPGTQGADNDNVTLENNTITVATNGIYAYGTASSSSGGLDNLAITGNNITSNTTIQNYGIQVGNALNSSLSQNTVSVTSSVSGSPVAISLETGFVNSTVSRNRITSALTTSTGGYGGRGITVGTGTATSGLTIANNVIYGVNGSNYSGFGNSSSMGIAIGVVGSSGTLTTTTGGVNLYYNSVNMAGTYSYSAACLTAALYVGSGASALDLRDNVLVNTLTNTNSGGSASKNYAIYSAAPSTAYTTINYDDYFVSGTQGVLGYLGADQATIAAWQTATGQDLNSIAADPLFNSATNLQPQTGSPVIGAGTPVSVTVDYTGAARSGTNPSIGAYESAADTLGPTIAYTPLGNTTSTANRLLAIVVTDASGVPTSGIGLPVLYFRKGTSGAFTANPSVFTGGSGYDCTLDYSLIGGVIAGDTLQYYVAAQDNTGNVSVNPSAGAGGLTPNPPAAATPPTTPSSFMIGDAALSGTLGVGSAETRTSLTNPGGVFDFINASVLTGNVTVNVTSDLTAETGAVALNEWAEGGVGGYTLTIKPSGAARVISGTGTTHLIKLNGADRVTFDGSLSGGTDRSLTISCAGSTQTVFWIGSASASNGANHDTIKNCVISGLDSAGTTISGIIAGSGTTLGNEAEAPNSNNAIRNNWILKAQNGMYLRGNTTTLDQNWLVTGNVIGSNVAGEKMSYRGLLFGNAQNATVSNNTILGVTTATTSTTTGIQVAFNISGGSITGNRVSDIKNTNTGGYGCNGMYLGAATTASNLTVANNFVYDVAAYGYNGTGSADNGYGIFIGGGGGYNLYYNSVRLTTDQTATTGITAAINISSAITTTGSLDLRDNIFANSQTLGTRYAIYCGAANTVFSNINSNDYFKGTAANLGYLGSARVDLAAWQGATGQDANSISADPLFVSTTDLHLQPCSSGVSPAIAAGTPIPGVTVDFDGNARSATTPDIGADETPRFTIVASAHAGGSISPSGNVPVACSHDQSFTITPSGGRTILDVLVDGGSVGPVTNYTFSGVTANHTITATFSSLGTVVGVVPDGSAASTPFTIVKNAVTPAHLDLAWGDSCGTAHTDFAVYEGTIGTWYSHASLLCSTGGAPSATDVTPGSGGTYYLIVPVSATAEGSYGTDSSGAQIPQGTSPCLVLQDTTPCP